MFVPGTRRDFVWRCTRDLGKEKVKSHKGVKEKKEEEVIQKENDHLERVVVYLHYNKRGRVLQWKETGTKEFVITSIKGVEGVQKRPYSGRVSPKRSSGINFKVEWDWEGT